MVNRITPAIDTRAIAQQMNSVNAALISNGALGSGHLVAQRSAFRTAMRRLWRSINGRVGLVLVGIITLIALVTPLIDAYNPRLDSNLTISRQAPSALHILRTDMISRDVLRRILHGARISLATVLTTIIIGSFLSTSIGIIAGYYGRTVDTIIQRSGELMQALPGIPQTKPRTA